MSHAAPQDLLGGLGTSIFLALSTTAPGPAATRFLGITGDEPLYDYLKLDIKILILMCDSQKVMKTMSRLYVNSQNTNGYDRGGSFSVPACDRRPGRLGGENMFQQDPSRQVLRGIHLVTEPNQLVS